jgi:hypothetical protein
MASTPNEQLERLIAAIERLEYRLAHPVRPLRAKTRRDEWMDLFYGAPKPHAARPTLQAAAREPAKSEGPSSSALAWQEPF